VNSLNVARSISSQVKRRVYSGVLGGSGGGAWDLGKKEERSFQFEAARNFEVERGRARRLIGGKKKRKSGAKKKREEYQLRPKSSKIKTPRKEGNRENDGQMIFGYAFANFRRELRLREIFSEHKRGKGEEQIPRCIESNWN